MMPPKKSKAARGASPAKAEEKKEEQEEIEKTGDENGVPSDDEVSDSEEKSHVNIFEETVVDGKRKRTEPPGEAKLKQWLASNFEEKEDVHYKFMDLYDAYVEECINEGVGGSLEGVVKKFFQEMFPKGFVLKEDSKYKQEIKERKKINRPKVQGDTFKLKPKEVLEKTFQELGNPKAGLRFNTIRQYIAGKYPALRVDVKPNYVKNALFMGVKYRYIDLLRGVGKSGVYRLYVEGEVSDDETETNKEDTKKAKKEETKEDDGEKTDGDATEDGDDAGTEEKPKDMKTDEEKDDKEKKIEKKKKSAPIPKSRQGKIIHSDPQKIEDTFPLAITFGTEPKQCSYRKIANYISSHYPDTNVDARLKACMEKGAERGFWEHITGSISSGTFKLTIDEFDPTDDDDMIGKVVNAIMACSEPKQCSAALLKNYVVEFHPTFKVGDHPNKFKKAIDRAESSGDLIRLSGIGGSGSFQLSYVFMPSPAILAAQDTESDYEEQSDDDVTIVETEDGEVDMSGFQDAYVPRPSKRRGKARAVSRTSFFDRNLEFQKNREASTIKRSVNPAKRATKRKAKGKENKGGKANKGKKGSRKVVPSTDSEDSVEEVMASSDEEDSADEYSPSAKKRKGKKEKKEKEEFVEAYKPRPSASRGGRARTPPREKPKSKKKAKGKAAKEPAPAKIKATPTKAALKAKPAQLISEEKKGKTPKGGKKSSAKATEKISQAAASKGKGRRSSSRRR